MTFAPGPAALSARLTRIPQDVRALFAPCRGVGCPALLGWQTTAPTVTAGSVGGPFSAASYRSVSTDRRAGADSGPPSAGSCRATKCSCGSAPTHGGWWTPSRSCGRVGPNSAGCGRRHRSGIRSRHCLRAGCANRMLTPRLLRKYGHGSPKNSLATHRLAGACSRRLTPNHAGRGRKSGSTA